ncbi:MAG: hypothetical protein ACUVR8_06895 [Acidobacteriota bacterium]
MTEDERRQWQAEIMTLGAEALPKLYERIVLGQRTRRFDLFHTPCRQPPVVQIQHTLLGIELKVGRRRLLCPDLATARYLAVFARLGVASVAVPYDISQLPQVADAFETAWQRMWLVLERHLQALPVRTRRRIRRQFLDEVRQAVEALGAGPAHPVFVQTTRQRPPLSRLKP